SCVGPQPVCSAFWQSHVVFRERVVDQTTVSSATETVKNLDGSYSTTQGPGYFRVRFSVLECSGANPNARKLTFSRTIKIPPVASRSQQGPPNTLSSHLRMLRQMSFGLRHSLTRTSFSRV